MNARKGLGTLLAAWLLTCLLTVEALAAPEPGKASDETGTPSVSSACAVLIEAQTGRVLYEKNANQRAYMASTTKIMTALLAAEYGALDELVAVPDAAVGVEGSSVYLARGERIRLIDLLYGLMLVSGNDAAVTIATHVGGNVADFVELMNARAESLGCSDTHFVNPNGLPDEAHYTTALDLSRIAAAAMQNETFRTVVGTTYYETASGDRQRTFKNKNKLLWQYDGGNGVKTGFTKAAGRCLVFSAERGGMTLVGAVLNAPDMWNDATALLDYGFDIVANKRLIDAAKPIAQVAVDGGKRKTLPVFAASDVYYPVALDGSDQIAWELNCKESLRAPVNSGQDAGELTLLVNGAVVKQVPLIVTESVPSADLIDYLRALAGRWCA